MGENSFLKDGGAFLIAFLLGSVSLHGMLFFLVNDANDLFLNDTESDSLFPLLTFIILYAFLPIASIFIWRYFLKHEKIKELFDKKPQAYKKFKALELSSIVAIVISWISFVIYNRLWLRKAETPGYYENFYWGAFIFLFIGFILLIISSVFLSRINFSKNPKGDPNAQKSQNKQTKKKEGPDDQKGHDEEANTNEKQFGIEFILVLIGWGVFMWWLMSMFIGHAEFKDDKFELGYTAAYEPKPAFVDSLAVVKKNINTYDEALDLLSEINYELISNTYVNRTFNNQIDKYIESIDVQMEDFNKVGNLDSVKLYSEPFENLTNHLAKFDIGDKKAEIDIWIKNTENKLKLFKGLREQDIIDDLKPALIKAQNYFQILFGILLLYGILYWRISAVAANQLLHSTPDNEDPDKLPELEFTKMYIALVFVLIVPILKPIETQDIEFNRPLWTVNTGTFKPAEYTPKPGTDNKSETSTIVINVKDGQADNPEIPEETIKKINEIYQQILILNNQQGADNTDELKKIQRKLKEIELEVSKIKRR